jgi:hypothetical protein
MNLVKGTAFILTACVITAGIGLLTTKTATAEDYESFTLSPGFEPNPAVGTGLSGGTRLVECATGESNGETTIQTYVDDADAPDHTVTLTDEIPNLSASVESDGDVTLVVEGPDGTFCSDDVDGLLPAISGDWPAGTYNIWIGDFVGDSSGTYRYQLVLTEQ